MKFLWPFVTAAFILFANGHVLPKPMTQLQGETGDDNDIDTSPSPSSHLPPGGLARPSIPDVGVENLTFEKKPRREKRKKRWALPTDIQNTLCSKGFSRRGDGECQRKENAEEDDYATG